ncbi:MAG: helix-turn-helix domain-containing protein [Halanaerobiales bacterium]
MIKKLKQYMKDNNINQKQLASLMNISEAHMSRLLSGAKKPGEKTVEAYFNLPGIKEKEQLYSITNYLMLEFSRGNITNKQLQEAISKTDIETKSLNPQD